MKHDNLRIEIGEARAEVEELYGDLLTVEVELDEELAGMFRLTARLLLHDDGGWSYLDDDRFTPWTRVSITAGLEDDTRQLLTGFITHLRPSFGAGLEQCQVEIWGMDASVLMDRQDRLKGWPNMKDSDIANDRFLHYGLTPKITDTKVVHNEEVSTIIQRETDIQLLRRLALRNGFECFVDGNTGYFRPPAVDDTPQPVLAVHFGDETNVDRFSLEVNALAPADVKMSQIDHHSGKILEETVHAGEQPKLGARSANSYLRPDMSPGLVQIGLAETTGGPEMEALCQGLFDRGEWFVTGEGEVAANEYGNILMPRGTVTIKGIGETHSGVYYVTHVTHRFTANGYSQVFRVKRNALMPTGSERFDSDADQALGAVAGAALEVSLDDT
jgi:phage protein D